jgi:iron(III) transport system permease protein
MATISDTTPLVRRRSIAAAGPVVLAVLIALFLALFLVIPVVTVIYVAFTEKG